MTSKEEEGPALEAQESLLYSSRHGELKVVTALLEAKKEGKITLDINCKGKSKSNLGWTPLHLATYFGHVDVVKALLEAGADVDEVNDTGDTALHKASFIGNEELVILLLNHKADVHIMNGEGRTAVDVCKTRDVQRLIEAAQRSERKEKETQLLNAARDGRLEDVQELLSARSPPNINCADGQGNSCLHCVAYRGHARVAVLLLQNGIDTTLRNHTGHLAVDLAKDNEMRSVLSVRPVQRLQRTAARHEGPLLKRARFLGWRPVWAVVQRGVLLYYASRAEAARAGGKWRARKYLDSATLAAPPHEPALLVVGFSDGDTHRLAVVSRDQDVAVCRQSWLTALGEHIAYSGHYLWAGAAPGPHGAPGPAGPTSPAGDAQDDCKPLGSMQDALSAAARQLGALDTQLRECAAILTALERSAAPATALHHSAYMRFQHACGTGQEALGALRHAAALVAQARDIDRDRLQMEIERNRVLEEALAGLARSHHALEMSVAEELTKSKRKKKTSSVHESQENFFDVYEASDDEDDTLVTAGLSSPLGALSPWGSSPDLDMLERRTPIGSLDGDRTPTNVELSFRDLVLPSGARSGARSGSPSGSRPGSWSGSQLSLHTALSPASSRGTLVSQGGHVYRNARHNYHTPPSSQWSL